MHNFTDACALACVVVPVGSRTLTALGVDYTGLSIREASFQNVGDQTIYVGIAVADVNSFQLLPNSTLTLSCGKWTVDHLRFYCAVPSRLNVVVGGGIA